MSKTFFLSAFIFKFTRSFSLRSASNRDFAHSASRPSTSIVLMFSVDIFIRTLPSVSGLRRIFLSFFFTRKALSCSWFQFLGRTKLADGAFSPPAALSDIACDFVSSIFFSTPQIVATVRSVSIVCSVSVAFGATQAMTHRLASFDSKLSLRTLVKFDERNGILEL